MNLIGNIARWTSLDLEVALIGLAACGGGGGGGGAPDLPPVILAAPFAGAAATPSSGDRLLLFLSENVVLTGAILDDQDLSLSSGSLGSITAPPVSIDGRTVQITLGAGVSFTPGTTTIEFSPGNDAVQDLGGQLGFGGSPVTITAGDGDSPGISAFTLDGIEGVLNGTGPAGGTLQVPPNGFIVDLDWSDPSSPIDAGATVLTADVNVTSNGQTILAGTNLASLLTLAQAGQTLSYTVPASVVFPNLPVQLSARVLDITGMPSAEGSFAFTVKALSDAVRPFETSVNGSQVWFIDTSRDLESYTHDTGNSVHPVTVNAASNGTPDLEDLFTILGLFGSNTSVNTTVLTTFETGILDDLATIHGGANIIFTFASPGTFPSGQSSVPYASFSFSQICLAGAEDPSGTTSVLGVALSDPNNATQNNDCLTAFQGTQRLGVFMHTMIDAGLRPPSSTLFRTTYDPLVPALGGTPIGNDAQDAARLAGSVNDARKNTIDLAISRLARAAAVTLAHECGHSVGLVKDGAMPAGLYGGDTIHFPGSTSGHIKNTAQFPAGSQNVMSPAISFDGALSTATRFNSLNLAYLRERVLYNQ